MISPEMVLLRDQIIQHFSLKDLHNLCFDLRIEFDNLPGDTLSDKARELVEHCNRLNLMTELVTRCAQLRPSGDWTRTINLSPSAANTELAVHKLYELKAILDESWHTYVTHNIQRNRLAGLLIEKYGEKAQISLGYDELFFQAYDSMNDEERELFHIIRGLTEESIYRINNRLRDWMDANNLRDLLPIATASSENLERALLQLKVHLNHWFAKYNSVFKNNPKRSLVYLGDEKAQGIAFPTHLSRALDTVLKELSS